MPSNLIRGGQIFWHQLAMLKQVIVRSLAVGTAASIIMTVLIMSPELPKCDFTAAFSYSKAKMVVWWDRNKLVFGHDNRASRHIPTIDAYDSKGLYISNIRAATIVSHARFKAEYIKASMFIEKATIIALSIGALLITVISVIWSIFGKKAKETVQLRGSTILSATLVASTLKKLKLTSHFKIGDMPLVKDSETKHILVTGATGSGKTNLFHILLPQIRAKNQPALVIDQTGEMIEHYYNPERGDIIFNPFDERSDEWNFWEEIKESSRLNSMATSMFCNSKTSDDMWNNASKQLFIDCVNYIANQKEQVPSIEKLHELLTKTPLREASKKLKDYAASALLDPAGDRTAMSIRSNTISFISWLGILQETNDQDSLRSLRSFTIKDWVKDTLVQKTHNSIANPNAESTIAAVEAVNPGRWLFISSRPQERTTLKPLQSILLDLAVLSLQQLSPNSSRRFWIIADELASLKKLDILPQSLAELRKYGGCILTALQSLNQLYEIYGHNNASAMFGQFATKFIFRTSEPQIARVISEMSGYVEYKEQQQNTSYGAHEHRDGISYTEQERRKALITVDDLSSLADLECFAMLPEPSVRLARIRMGYVK